MAKKVEEKTPAVREISRLQVKYKEEVVPALIKTFGYKTIMEVPKIEKIVLNMRFGDIKDNSKSIQLATKELEMIAGQKSVPTKAKNSVATSKSGKAIKWGQKASLPRDRWGHFLEKLLR